MANIAYYFDHAATTPLRQEAYDVMKRFLLVDFGNPNSLHEFGFVAKEALDEARATIAKSIGASSTEIYFTGSGTESNNLVILGVARRLRKMKRGNEIITSCIEHPSVLKACDALEQDGFKVTKIPVDQDGLVDLNAIQHAIRRDTVLISIMHANNVVGTIQPIEEIGNIARKQGVLFHTDAVQTYCKIPMDVSALKADLITINAHKIGGPKGVAALYVKSGIRLEPLIFGGGQERNLRPATQNVPAICAFATAAKDTLREQPDEMRRLRELREYLLTTLLQRIPGCKQNGHRTSSLPTHINISIDQIEGQALMLELDRLGFATSSGSACSSTDHEPSYVLLAMTHSRDRALESLRITMGRTTTRESVTMLIKALEQVVATWRHT